VTEVAGEMRVVVVSWALTLSFKLVCAYLKKRKVYIAFAQVFKHKYFSIFFKKKK